VAPDATVTDDGTVNSPVLPNTSSAAPPGGAALFSVITQLRDLPERRSPAGQLTEEGPNCKIAVTPAGRSATVNALVPNDATRTTFSVEETVPAEITKLTPVTPAGTLTMAGALTAGELVETATFTPPAGAAAASVIAQLMELFDETRLDAQVNPESAADPELPIAGSTFTVNVREAPLSVAVSTAVSAAPTHATAA
jgi:hypothetical protein